MMYENDACLRGVVNDEGVSQVAPKERQILQIVALHKQTGVPVDAVANQLPADTMRI